MSNESGIYLCSVTNALHAGFLKRVSFASSKMVTSKSVANEKDPVTSSYDFRGCFFNAKHDPSNTEHKDKTNEDIGEELIKIYKNQASIENLLPGNRLLYPGCRPPKSIQDIPASKNRSSFFLLSDFKGLQCGNGDLFPIFGMAYLFDVHRNQRISEVFHFDNNSVDLLEMFSESRSINNISSRHWKTMATKCLFHISLKNQLRQRSSTSNLKETRRKSENWKTSGTTSEFFASSEPTGLDDRLGRRPKSNAEMSQSNIRNNPNFCSDCSCQGGIFLIIRIERVLLSGDINESLETATKEKKVMEKLQSIVARYCKVLGHHRAPIAWTAIDLTPFLMITRSIQNDKCIAVDKTVSQTPRLLTDSPKLNRNDRCASLDRRRLRSRKKWATTACGGPLNRLKSFSDDQNTNSNGSIPKSSPVTDRANIPSARFCINSFYKLEPGKAHDEELARHLVEIHRMVATSLEMIRQSDSTDSEPFKRKSSSGTVISQDEINVLLEICQLSSKRLKRFPGIVLNLQLFCSDNDSVISLLRKTGDTEQIDKDMETESTERRSLPLVSTGYSDYKCSIFEEIPAHTSCVSVDANIVRPIREVLELPAPLSISRNVIYVYPKNVQIPSTVQSSARNISIHVQLCHSDEQQTRVVPTVYGKSSSPKFTSGAFTSVHYHNRVPEFYDEIKIELPAELDENHYLLFTFLHVSCHLKKIESEDHLEAIIGYSWLPILSEGVLKSTNVTLMMTTVRPSSSLSKLLPKWNRMSEMNLLDKYKWADRTRDVFQVTTTVVSTGHPRNLIVENLLSALSLSKIVDTLNQLELRQTARNLVESIQCTPVEDLMPYTCQLFDGLLRLMHASCLRPNKGSSGMMSTTFASLYLLMSFVEHLCHSQPERSDNFGRNNSLVTYLAGNGTVSDDLVLCAHLCGEPFYGIPLLEDLFNCDVKSDKVLNVNLPTTILSLFSHMDEDIVLLDSLPKSSWWLVLELLIRLLMEQEVRMIRTVDSKTARRYPLNSSDRLLEQLRDFIRSLGKFIVLSVIHQTESESIHKANFALAHFLYDLIPLIPVEFVIQETWNYCIMIRERLNKVATAETVYTNSQIVENLIRCELNFMHIVNSHRDFTKLALTQIPEIASSLLTFRVKDNVLLPSAGNLSSQKWFQQFCEHSLGCSVNSLCLLTLANLELCMELKLPKLLRLSTCSFFWALTSYRPEHQKFTNVCLGPLSDHISLQCGDFRLFKAASWFMGILDILDEKFRDFIIVWRTLYQQNMGLFGKDDSVHTPNSSKGAKLSSRSTTINRKNSKSTPNISLAGGSQDPLESDSSRSRSVFYEGETSLPSAEKTMDLDVFKLLLLSKVIVMNFSRAGSFNEWLNKITTESLVRSTILLYMSLNIFQDVVTASNLPANEPQKPREEKTLCTVSVDPSWSRDSLNFRDNKEPTGIVLRKSPSAIHISTTNLVSEQIYVSHQARNSQNLVSAGTELSSFPTMSVTGTIAEIAKQIITSLFNSSSNGKLTDHSLPTFTHTELRHLMPFNKHRTDRKGTTPLDMVMRLICCSFSFVNTAQTCRHLCCSVQMVMDKYPQFLSEDQPHLLAALVHQLMVLCLSHKHQLQRQSLQTLYYLLRSYHEYKKNIYQLEINLHLSLVSLIHRNMTTLSVYGTPEDSNRDSVQTERVSRLCAALNHLRLMATTSDKTGETIEDPAVFLNVPTTSSSIFILSREMKNCTSTKFSERVSQLASNLTVLVKLTTHLEKCLLSLEIQKEQNISYEDYFEILDTFYAVADCSRQSPEMRIYWLTKMAQKYTELSRFLEAGQCFSHCAAVVVEHLTCRNTKLFGSKTIGCAELADSLGSVNMLEESCLHGLTAAGLCCVPPLIVDELNSFCFKPDDLSIIGICGWYRLTKQAATAFATARCFELVPRIFSPLLPYLERFDKRGCLFAANQAITNAHSSLLDLKSNQRLFNCYFRVRVYGSIAGHMDGTDFVYSEPAWTRLPEVTQRIQVFYTSKHGEGNAVMIKDANDVDRTTLDSSKMYFQVNYVEPYFEEFELRRRGTVFARNYGLKRFTYSIAFTLKGPCQGSVKHQYQRDVVITTERHFPYISTRLAVVKTASKILSPIEVALKDVTRRVNKLDELVNTKPVDLKMLQMFLQGCIGTTVNQGPLEVALAFLQPGDWSLPPQSTLITDELSHMDVRNQLRIVFQRMLNVCQQALRLNPDAADPNMDRYYQEMERQYENVRHRLAPLLLLENAPKN